MSARQDVPTFILIDGHALIYRAFHAFPELTDPQGRIVNAVYGFTRILLKVIRDHEPEYIAVAFDHKDPTLRSTQFEAYKAQREAMPDDLIPQIQIIKEVVSAMNIPQFELSGYEADDLVGTLSLQAEQGKKKVKTVVVTGDKDLLQLVRDEQTLVFIPGRGKFSVDVLYDELQVEKKMGVAPSEVPDLKGLMGDSSDNIPGVKGVGAKTAGKLLTTFGTVEKLYQKLATTSDDELKKNGKTTGLTPAVLKKLRADEESAFLSKELATIQRDVPIKLDLPACRVKQYDKEKVAEIFEELDFKSLMALLPEDAFEEAVASALF